MNSDLQNLSTGPVLEVTGNTPLLLTDPAKLWVVSAAWLDVFAVPLCAGQPAGLRSHLVRVEAGQVLFAVDPRVAQGEIGLLAVGHPGSRLMGLDAERFRQSAADPACAASLAALVDTWVQALASAVARDRLPPPASPLEADRTTLWASNSTVRPVRGVLWVPCAAGDFRFLDQKTLPLLTTDCLFPVTERGWLTTLRTLTLTAQTTAAAFADPRCWVGLDLFHQIILNCALLNARRAVTAERDRLRQKAHFNTRLIRNAMAWLAAVSRADDDVEPVDGLEEPSLLAACRLVGASLQVPMKSAQRSPDNNAWTDPVQAIANVSHLRIRRVTLQGDWWRRDNGPLLAFYDSPIPSSGRAAPAPSGQPVALLPRSPSRYVLADPTTDQQRPVTAREAARLRPRAYAFYRPFTENALKPWGLFQFALAGCRRDWWMVVVLGLAGSGLALFTPYAMGVIFDRILPAREQNLFLLFVLTLAGTAVATALFRLVRGIATQRLEMRMYANVQSALWDRLLALPMTFFRGYTAGDLSSRAGSIDTIRWLVTDIALAALLTLVFSLSYTALLFYYNVKLASLACVLFLVVLVYTCLAGWRELPLQRRLHQKRGRISGIVLQMLWGITRLRVAGAEDRGLAVWAREFSQQRRLQFRARGVANKLATFNTAAPLACSIALFASASLLPAGELTAGAFVAFNVAFMSLLSSALSVSSTISSMVQIVPLYERARPILEAQPEVDDTKVLPGPLSGDIELSRVSFRYGPDSPPILQEISVRIRPGEFVAFVGRSGAGKSTLIRLLLGFEAPSSGSLYYDGQNLAGLDVQAVRRQLGVVLQTSKVLAGDILGNIIGSSLLTEADAWEAARLSGIAEDIERLPRKMATVLPDGGSTLSGGQRQRLLIARAIVARPRILLLDEATSALDNETQARVCESLKQLQATRVVVAHRLSTIRDADRIYVVDGGRIVQQGSYDELVRQPGLFGELAQRQQT